MCKYWINSNTGDVVTLTEEGHYYLLGDKICEEEFKNLKGYVPIKAKKIEVIAQRGGLLYRSESAKKFWSKYKPTKKGGEKE